MFYKGRAALVSSREIETGCRSGSFFKSGSIAREVTRLESLLLAESAYASVGKLIPQKVRDRSLSSTNSMP